MAKLKPIHPGEILREEFMLPLRLNANKLALALSDVILGQRYQNGMPIQQIYRFTCYLV